MGEVFECSVWDNGSGHYAVGGGRPKESRYFSPQSPMITVLFQGNSLQVSSDSGKGSETFWGKCPEFRHPVISEWLRDRIAWESQVKLQMKVMEPFNRFRLHAHIAEE
jgi:hypothetical protein